MQADLRIEKLLSIVSHPTGVSVRHAFIRQCSFQVPFSSVRFALYFRFHCLRFIFSIQSVIKALVALCGCFPGTSEKCYRISGGPDYCLILPWKTFACPEGEKSEARNMEKEMLHSCMYQSHSLFCFPLCILLCSSTDITGLLFLSSNKARAWMDLREL